MTWRSIWSDKGLLQFGFKWRTGLRQMLTIWNDYWLPGRDMVTVKSARVQIVNRVCDLIDPYLNCWKEDPIEVIFSEEEATVFLGIPLSWNSLMDKQIWYGEHTGE